MINLTNTGVQTWMGTSLLIETTATAITWSVLPLPLQIWSIGCLLVDAFIFARELLLRPSRREPQTAYRGFVPPLNVGFVF